MEPVRHPRIIEVLQYLDEFLGKETFAVSDCPEATAIDISNPANPGIAAHVVVSDSGHIPVTLMLSDTELGQFECPGVKEVGWVVADFLAIDWKT